MDFPQLNMSDWIALGSLLVAAVALIWNISLGYRKEVKSDTKLGELEESMEKGLRQLDNRINAVDKSFVYLVGFLDGAGITKDKTGERSL